MDMNTLRSGFRPKGGGGGRRVVNLEKGEKKGLRFFFLYVSTDLICWVYTVPFTRHRRDGSISIPFKLNGDGYGFPRPQLCLRRKMSTAQLGQIVVCWG